MAEKMSSWSTVTALTAAMFFGGVDTSRAVDDRNVKMNGRDLAVALGVPWVNPEAPPYNARTDGSDCTAAFQQIIADYRDTGGCIILFRGRYVVQGGQLKFPDVIHGYGFVATNCGFVRAPGTFGPLVECVPWRSATVTAYTHLWHNITLDSNLDGCIVTNGRTNPGGATDVNRATITDIPAAEFNLIAVGSMFEGIGIPDNMFVRSKDAVVGGFGSLVLEDINGVLMTPTGPNHVDNGAWFTRDKCVARPAKRLVCTTTSGTQQLTTTTTAGLAAGWRMYGVNLETDSDDLSQWTRVLSVNNATTLTMDRNASASGAFLCVFYVSNDGMLWSEPSLVHNYDPSKVYDSAKKYRRPVMEGVSITQSSGHNCVIRPGGNGYHLDNFCNFNNAYQSNIYIGGCADGYWERCGVGPSWKQCMRVTASSTPRGSGETYFTYLSDKYYEIDFLGIREGQLYMMEVNGRLNIKVKPGDAAPILNVALINFKFAPNNRVPYGRTNAYIRVAGGVVNATACGFKAARDDITPTIADQLANGLWGPLKPDWICETVGADAGLYVGSANWVDDVAKKECPYLLARTNDSRLYGYYYETDSKQILSCQRGSFAPALTCATPGDLSVVYTDRYGTWTAGGGTLTFHMVLAFTPTYTTATGNVLITGLPLIPPLVASGRQLRCSVSCGSIDMDWGTNLTQLDGAILSNGNIQVRATGDNKAETTIVLARMPSGTTQRLEVWGTVPLVGA